MEKVITVREDGSVRRISKVVGESMTEQSHREAVNINTIVARARRGILPVSTGVQPNYGDFSSGLDFQRMMEKVNDAKNDMAALPAAIRKRFKNDPRELIDFMADEANREEAIELGLIAKPEEEVPKVPGADVKPAAAPVEPVEGS